MAHHIFQLEGELPNVPEAAPETSRSFSVSEKLARYGSSALSGVITSRCSRLLSGIRQFLPRRQAESVVATLSIFVMAETEHTRSKQIDNPRSIYRACADMKLFNQEVLRVLLLDTRYRHISSVEITKGSIDESTASAVFHFAAHMAVTTSLMNPRLDFEVNAMGTLNVLEALRSLNSPPPLIFTSTNKVYGSLGEVNLTELRTRYEPMDERQRQSGIAEDQRLDFYSPYGCSKGTADQYVLDYARLFGVSGVVFRMSCIYGPHQFGTEDQGWVAHFLLKAAEGRPITLFGNGKQVRDILFVEDLVDALLLAREQADALAGKAFNIGGGVGNTTSLLELVSLITHLEGVTPEVEREDWRPGDQRYYVTDLSKFRRATGWAPKVGVEKGIRRLHTWMRDSQDQRRLAAAS
jgi:nucleoside-diphosphate-sugar epimerase